jgi:hypothetical protein
MTMMINWVLECHQDNMTWLMEHGEFVLSDGENKPQLTGQ